MPARKSESPTTDVILRHWREAVPDDRLAHLVKDATRGLVRALTMRLAEHRVSFGHWAFLRILWETDGLTQRELSLQAGVMEPTTFAAIKAMEKLGYVERRQKPSSRKNVYVFLTPAGRALKSRLVPFAEAVNEIAVRGIPSADVAVTRKTLLAMIENLAVEEAASQGAMRRMPSTRHLGRLVAEAGNGARRRAAQPNP
jgi:MarR family transcriptional regulator, organic hydroperoxide resistance regulator